MILFVWASERGTTKGAIDHVPHLSHYDSMCEMCIRDREQLESKKRMKNSGPPIVDDAFLGQIVLLPGMDHYEVLGNRQDQIHHVWVESPTTGRLEVAVVGCDGCSSSATSEAGAALLSQFSAAMLAQLVKEYGVSQYSRILTRLYGEIISWLRGQVELYPGGKEYLSLLDLERSGGEVFTLDHYPHLKPVYYFIDRNFMATMVGCYFGVDGLIVFQRGDGGYLVDGVFHTESYLDFPPYIGYAMIPEQKMLANLQAVNAQRELVGDEPLQPVPGPAFTGMFFPQAQSVVVFSDGLTSATEPLYDVLNQDQIWGRVDPVNLWGDRKNRLRNWVRTFWKQGDLKDDVFLAAFCRVPTE